MVKKENKYFGFKSEGVSQKVIGVSSSISELLKVSKSVPSPGKSDFKKTTIPGINTPMKELGLIGSPTQSKERKLKGLSKAQRSDLVEEVLGTPPGWLVRWGSTWTFLILAMLVFITFFIEYPDIVKGRMVLTSTNTARSLNTKIDGRIVDLPVQEGQQIGINSLVGRMESLADYGQIKKLKQILEQYRDDKNRYTGQLKQQLSSGSFDKLGEIQETFQRFVNSLVISSEYRRGGVAGQKEEILYNDIRELSEIEDNLRLQLRNLQQDYKLAQDEYYNQSRLYAKGLISANDLRIAQSKMVNKKQAIDQTESMFNSNSIQKNQKRQEILELQRNSEQQKASFTQEYNSLMLAIDNWEKNYLLISPVAGKVMYTQNWQLNQQVRTGQRMFYIIPQKANSFGEMYVSQYNIGKIKSGQRVILKFDGYPFQEFGTVDGKVESVSEIPIDSVYLVKVNLPDLGNLSKKKEMNLKTGMAATGEIVTEELKLIEKIFYEIRKYINQ